ncbi:Protein phosphatase methylesterase 1 [Dispira parvispora]|uniref:Protein phosphatase methylesterase 1 n=1 Tax=Dispira parvispora TaxID=1520584 RepID=A0A9W8AN06_9FUNG|nr:Protein phosphatase methylesterase 1 [Dispira parvispora]
MNAEDLRKKLFKAMNAPAPSIDRLFTSTKSQRYEAESWEAYFEERRVIQPTGSTDQFVVYCSLRSKGPLFVFHHGAGHAALAFALVAQSIRERFPDEISLLAYDCRGHGGTCTAQEYDLSLDTLATDLGHVIAEIYQPESVPDTVLVGHSMGGAVVSHAAYHGMVTNLLGLVVIDIVEGNAMAALGKIKRFCDSRPQRFPTMSDAIQWFLESGSIVNPASAQVSVPPLLIQVPEEQTMQYTWRTKLEASEKYWPGKVEKFS